VQWNSLQLYSCLPVSWKSGSPSNTEFTLCSGVWDNAWSCSQCRHKDLKIVASGFRRVVNEICALLGYYATSSGNPFTTFRDNVSVPSSKVKKFKKASWLLKTQKGADLISRSGCWFKRSHVRLSVSIKGPASEISNFVSYPNTENAFK
jgi:hypothetical protein